MPCDMTKRRGVSAVLFTFEIKVTKHMRRWRDTTGSSPCASDVLLLPDLLSVWIHVFGSQIASAARTTMPNG